MTSLPAQPGQERPQDRFIHQLVQMVVTRGYDGVDIDWELPEPERKQNVVEFIEDLHQALKGQNPDLWLTMAVPVDRSSVELFSPRLENYVDLLNVMAYNAHVFASADEGKHAGHNSPLRRDRADGTHGTDLSYAQWLKFWEKPWAEKQKIVLGIPCYGVRFPVKRLYQGFRGETTELPFKQIQKVYGNGTWEPHYDSVVEAPWISSKGTGARWLISYDNRSSVRAKGSLARSAVRSGVRGIFFWEISQDFAPNSSDEPHPLLQAATEAFFTPRAPEGPFLRPN